MSPHTCPACPHLVGEISEEGLCCFVPYEGTKCTELAAYSLTLRGAESARIAMCVEHTRHWRANVSHSVVSVTTYERETVAEIAANVASAIPYRPRKTEK